MDHFPIFLATAGRRIVLSGGGDAALAKTMALIAKGPKAAASKPVGSDVPDPLSAYIGGGLNDVKWRPIGLGVRQAVLKTSHAATARLLYIPSGAAVPDHGHRGTELTLVLQGAFRDETARFAAGDVEAVSYTHLTLPTIYSV